MSFITWKEITLFYGVLGFLNKLHLHVHPHLALVKVSNFRGFGEQCSEHAGWVGALLGT